MKRLSIAFLLILFAASGLQAQKQMTRNGHVWFFSHTPIEDIEAHNNQATSILDPATGEMAFMLLMRGFQFDKALMQEHFNEKYVESDKFPKATFEGKITNLSEVKFNTDGTYPVTVKGTLTIHGIAKEIEAKGEVKVVDGKISSSSTFPITLADHEITIPSMAKDKIAPVVDAHVDINYKPSNR
ncbi:MAG: YceI family protein [Bacteroidia bacterium]|nr:YceI family protein [Bacteroidia bacterium]